MSLNDFQILGKLGEGAYSSVFKVRRITDERVYALKKVRMVNLSEKERENALNEVRILASIHNPYIIAYKEAFMEKSTQSLWY
jgi:NIMA (never in mitosis gene a)-related kinase